MTELLISSQRTSGDDLRSLCDRLHVAIPDAEPVVDKERVGLITLFDHKAYAPEESSESESSESEGVPIRVGILLPGPDVVSLVLPAVAGVTAKAAVDVAVDWLRGLRQKPTDEKAVLIYGPGGEPLHKVRLRADAAEPEVFAPPWPRPPRRRPR
jgi:hypothetical protein